MFPAQLEPIINQLQSVERRKKPKLLVVDDEPDNLDLLYRTFRRDFQVLKAESGIKALEILAQEGEVAVIISDQRMPEMKGTEFLSKTVPQFPNTIRIILTGFTDVEDLVDAINSGQVYKYITKPWDPNELKVVVQRATDNYEVLKHRLEELERAQAQTEVMGTILEAAQINDSLETCLTKIATGLVKSFSASACLMQLVQNSQLLETKGSYATNSQLLNLEQDPLIVEAIATKQTQIWLNSGTTPLPTFAEHYKDEGIQIHLVLPIIYRDKLLAALSLQWQKLYPLQEDELKLIHLLGQQLGLAINSMMTYS